MVFLRKENWEGFCDIFDGMGVLFEQNYDAVFPDRERAKQMALKWLSEDRYNDLIGSKKPSEADYENIVRLVAGLKKMKPVLEQKFPDGSPFPSNILKRAQLWEKSCKPKEAPPVAATPSGASQAGISGNAEPMDTPKQAQGIIKKGAAFLIEKEPLMPMGFRIMRALRWDLLEKAPPADGGKTQLTAPQPQQRVYFQNLISQNDWKTALEKAEATFAAGANHLWLDLQRIIASACKELGSDYALIRKSILIETASLLKRIPELVNLNYSDGSPFCDDATKDWITAEVQTAIAGGDSSPSAAGGRLSDPLEAELRSVNGMVAAGKIEDALDVLRDATRSSSSGRDNFRRSIAIGNLLLKAKQPDIAVSVLESLDRKVEQYNLVVWDQDVVVEAWSVLVRAYKAAKVQKQPNVVALIHEKQNNISSKISLVDPGKAYNLNK